MALATGEQYELIWENQRAVVSEVGATLRSYEISGRQILDGFDPDQVPSGARGKLLAPWPNRIGDGRWKFGGQEHQLPLNEPEKSNAIHGLVMWVPWKLRNSSDSTLELSYTLYPQPGYPFLLELGAHFELGPRGLTIRTTAQNVGRASLPWGCGWHPYFGLGTGQVDELRLRCDATSYIPTDERLLPLGEPAPVPSHLDFRSGPAIGDRVLDVCLAGLEAGANGLRRVELRSPDGFGVAIWMGLEFSYLMLFTGDTLAPEEQRRSIAIEPMTCPANAFVTGRDLVVLAPGERHVSTWGIQPLAG
jgi:aldose 1-epimerase